MKIPLPLALCALPIFASCAANAPVPTVLAGVAPVVAPAPIVVAQSDGLTVTPLEADAEITADLPHAGAWKFKISTPKANQSVYFALEMMERERVVQRLDWMNIDTGARDSEALVTVDWPATTQGEPKKMTFSGKIVNAGGTGTFGETINDPFGPSSQMWSSIADPQKDGSFLLAEAGRIGRTYGDVAKNDISLVCRFALGKTPAGKTVEPPAPIPFALVAEKIEFDKPRADLMKDGWAYDATIAVSYRGPRPDWWGREKGVGWTIDPGFVVPDGKGGFRRVPAYYGGLMPAGSIPYYDSTRDAYVNTILIAYSDIKGRAGKLILKQEIAVNEKQSAAEFQPLSTEKFARRRSDALGTATAWAKVPLLKRK